MVLLPIFLGYISTYKAGANEISRYQLKTGLLLVTGLLPRKEIPFPFRGIPSNSVPFLSKVVSALGGT